MRILYHHRTRATDAQRVHILEMVQAFRTLGHEVEIVALSATEGRREGPQKAGEAGWKRLLRQVPLATEVVQLGYNLVGVPLLAAKLLRRKVDLVYERYALFNFAGVLAARLAGVPIVLEVNSPLALEQRQDGDIRAARLAAWAERTICNWAHRVVAVSGPLRRLLVGNGVEPSRLVVLSNGVSLHRRPDPAEVDRLRVSLGLQNKTVVGFAGWFKKWHGLDLLLEAFDRFRLPEKGVALLLIGDGPAMPELRETVRSRGLEASIIFTGAVPHEKTFAYLQLADIAVQPAANCYCCPMKILEYMALAKVIVAPRQENIAELLEEGQEARFFRPGDVDDLGRTLQALADHPQERLRLGRAAFDAIERRGFLWSSNAEKVIAYHSGRGVSPGAKASPNVNR